MIKKFNEFVGEAFTHPDEYEEQYAKRREETRRRMMMAPQDIENEERLKREAQQSERVHNCAVSVFSLDRAELTRLLGDIRGLIEPAQFEDVVNRLFDNDDLLRSFKGQAEKFSTEPADPFELVGENPAIAKRLIPFAIAQAKNLGMDETAVLEA